MCLPLVTAQALTTDDFENAEGGVLPSDIYVRKLSGQDGSLIWERVLGTDADDRAQNAVLTTEGDIVLVGVTRGALAPDSPPPLPETLDGFVSRLDGQTGELTWIIQLHSRAKITSRESPWTALERCWLPGTQTATWKCRDQADPLNDAFIAKFDATTGAPIFLKQTFTDVPDVVGDLAVGPDDNPIVVGSTKTLNFDFIPTQALAAKFDGTTGEQIWRQTTGRTGLDNMFNRVVLDENAGDIYAVGYQGRPDTRDGFYARLSGTDGSDVWSRSFNTGRQEALRDLAILDEGLVLVGATTGDVGEDVRIGQTDAFGLYIDPETGDTTGSFLFGTRLVDEATAVAVAPEGAFVVAGQSDGAIYEQPNPGFESGFLVKFKRPDLSR